MQAINKIKSSGKSIGSPSNSGGKKLSPSIPYNFKNVNKETKDLNKPNIKNKSAYGSTAAFDKKQIKYLESYLNSPNMNLSSKQRASMKETIKTDESQLKGINARNKVRKVLNVGTPPISKHVVNNAEKIYGKHKVNTKNQKTQYIVLAAPHSLFLYLASLMMNQIQMAITLIRRLRKQGKFPSHLIAGGGKAYKGFKKTHG